MTDLEKYEKEIESKILSESLIPSDNEGLDKAKVIIKQIVKHSSNKIVIFCKELSGDVYASPQICESIKQALLRSVRFEIFIQSESLASSSQPLLDLFKKFASDKQVTIKSLHNIKSFSEASQNFCIVDNKMVRIETQRENRVGKFYASNQYLVKQLERSLESMRNKGILIRAF